MIHYSPENLITSEDIKRLNMFSYKLENVYNRNVKSFKSTLLDLHIKEIFLEKVLNWYESEFKVRIESHNSKNFESYMIHYHHKDYFVKHNDNTYTRDKNYKREYVLGFHLNNDYEGGEFCVYNNESQGIIKNNPGLVYAFDSSLYHEVKPIKKGIKKKCSHIYRFNKYQFFEYYTKNYINKTTRCQYSNLWN